MVRIAEFKISSRSWKVMRASPSGAIMISREPREMSRLSSSIVTIYDGPENAASHSLAENNAIGWRKGYIRAAIYEAAAGEQRDGRGSCEQWSEDGKRILKDRLVSLFLGEDGLREALYRGGPAKEAREDLAKCLGIQRR